MSSQACKSLATIIGFDLIELAAGEDQRPFLLWLGFRLWSAILAIRRGFVSRNFIRV